MIQRRQTPPFRLQALGVRWGVALCGFLLVLMLPTLALAHGGGIPVIAGEPAGPYRLFAWVNPNPLVAGVIHVTVAVTKPVGDREQPVTGAGVDVTFVQAGSEPRRAAADASSSNQPGYYEADLAIEQPGEWQVTLQVQGADGAGESSFPVTVAPAAGGNSLLTWGGIAAIVVGIILFGVAIARRGPHNLRQTKRETP